MLRVTVTILCATLLSVASTLVAAADTGAAQRCADAKERRGQTSALAHNACAEGAPHSMWNHNAAQQEGSAAYTVKSIYSGGDTVVVKSSRELLHGFVLEVFRVGHYGGAGAAFIATGDSYNDASAGVDVIGAWRVPEDAPSGLYFASAKHREMPGSLHPGSGESDFFDDRSHARHEREVPHVQAFFVVASRNHSNADIVYRVADTTWGATERGAGRFTFDSDQVNARRDAASSVFSVDVPAIKFIESLGVEVAYVTSKALDAANGNVAALMGSCKVFAQAATDQARSTGMRRTLKAMPRAGVHRLFLGAGESTRRTLAWSDDRSFLIAESLDAHDPSAPATTATDAAAALNADNELAYIQWHAKPIVVTARYSNQRFWAASRAATHSQATHKLHRSAVGRLVSSPVVPLARNEIDLARTPLDWAVAPGTRGGLRHLENATHRIVLQRDPETRALTLHANSDQFASALDAFRDFASSPIDTPWGSLERRVHVERDPLGHDATLQQMVLNVLNAMNVATGSLPKGLMNAANAGHSEGPSCHFLSAEYDPALPGPRQVRVRVAASAVHLLRVSRVMVRLQGTSSFVELDPEAPVTGPASTWTGVVSAPEQIQPHHRLECHATDDNVNSSDSLGTIDLFRPSTSEAGADL